MNYKEKLAEIKKQMESGDYPGKDVDPRLSILLAERKEIADTLADLQLEEQTEEVEELTEALTKMLRVKDNEIKWGKRGMFPDENGNYAYRRANNRVRTVEGFTSSGRVELRERRGLSNWGSYILWRDEKEEGAGEIEVEKAHKRLSKGDLQERIDRGDYILHEDRDKTDFYKKVDKKKFMRDRNGKIIAYKEAAVRQAILDIIIFNTKLSMLTLH